MACSVQVVRREVRSKIRSVTVDRPILHEPIGEKQLLPCLISLPVKTVSPLSLTTLSGPPPPISAHTRRFDKLPSEAMSKAVSFFPWDSAMINVALSGVTAMPLGKAIPSATRRAELSGVTRAMIPGRR